MLTKILLYVWLAIGLILLPFTDLAHNYTVYAAGLTDVGAVLSDPTTAHTSTSYTISFTTITESDTKQINLQFSTTSGGSTKPAALNLTSASLASTAGIGSSWSLDSGSASSGLLKLTRTSAVSIAASSTASISLDSITNPALYDCTATTGLFDTCYLNVTTFSDDGSTSIDSGSGGFQIKEDPYLHFEISGVSSGATHNGITTSVTSNSTTLNFGRLTHGTAKYAAQALFIQTNAPGGYKVTAKLDGPILGSNTNNQIDPFAAENASWSTPQLWTTPDGSVANHDSGWFGANTTDTRVSGWSGNTSGKFGPLGTVARTVATSAEPERSGVTVYLSYVLGINDIQTTDVYNAKVIYNVQATY